MALVTRCRFDELALSCEVVMSPSPITSVRIGGRSYRLQSSASSEDLTRYAEEVDRRLHLLPKAQQTDPKSLLLVAFGLVHELEQARAACEEARRDTERRLRSLLSRLDESLHGTDENGDELPEVPVSSDLRSTQHK